MVENFQSGRVYARQFEHRSTIPATVEAVHNFYKNPKALSQLTPFPIAVQVLRDNRQSLTQGELEFRLWFGPIPIRWLARHESIDHDRAAFCDKMVEGPMALWEHAHVLTEGPDGIEIIDRITLAHKPGWRGWLTRLFFDGLPLRFLFIYRHWRTKHEIVKTEG